MRHRLSPETDGQVYRDMLSFGPYQRHLHVIFISDAPRRGIMTKPCTFVAKPLLLVQVLIALWFAGPWFREEIMRHAVHGVALALAETLQVCHCDDGTVDPPVDATTRPFGPSLGICHLRIGRCTRRRVRSSKRCCSSSLLLFTKGIRKGCFQTMKVWSMNIGRQQRLCINSADGLRRPGARGRIGAVSRRAAREDQARGAGSRAADPPSGRRSSGARPQSAATGLRPGDTLPTVTEFTLERQQL